MGKYYEATKQSIKAENGVEYTVSGTVTRGKYTAEDTLPEGAAVGDRKRIMIVFRKGHKGGAFRTYDGLASVMEFIAENSLISDEAWSAREKTTSPKSTVSPIVEMTAGDLGGEAEVDGESLGDDPAEQETVQEVVEEVNTTDKFLRNEKGHITGKNPNYIAPAEVTESVA